MSTALPQSGGTTASFSNAPQAGADSFAYIEDYLMANGLLYNQATRTITLDVMANDLGGRAKSLFSIDDGLGNQLTDLATTDLLTNQAYSAWQMTAQGNWMRIYNGKIEYRLADGAGGYRDVNSLNEGEILTDSFTYAIKLGNGTLSWARVTISLTGNNDAATISGSSTGTVVEAGGDDNALPGTPSALGTLTVNDVDSGQATFAPPPAASLAGAFGNFTFNPATGQWTYTLDNSRSATESLAQGETALESLTVTSLDGTATRTITVTITGTNDAPVIAGAAQTGSVAEEGTQTAGGAFTASDVDNGAMLTFSGNADSPYGAFAITAAGAWTYTLDNAAAQALADGESVTETFTVTVTDEHNATDTETVTITITGTNDAPVISGAAQSGSVTEDGAVQTATGAFTATDVDTGAVLAFSGNADSPYGAFAITTAGAWTYTLDNDAAQSLADGVSVTETFTVTVTDDKGATDTETVTITITGTNDAPVITSGDFAGDVQEDGTADGSAPTVSGTIYADDIDNGATWSFSSTTAGTYGSFAIGPDTGVWTYTLNNGLAATQALAAGESHVEIFTVTVTDEHGLTSFEQVEVTVSGDNDAPTITSAAQSGAVQEDDVLTASGQVSANDVDNGALLAYSGNATSTYGSFAVNAFTGAWTYTLDNANHQDLTASSSITEVFTVTVSDGLGGTTTQDVSITITGKDEPVVATLLEAVFNGIGDSNDFDDAGGTPSATAITNFNGNGAQTFNASNLADTINAGTGNDTIYGHNGDDTIRGEGASDISLFGQRGDDLITGGQGADEIFGGSGADRLYGFESPDSNGNNTANNDGADGLYGGSGADRIYGQNGADLITGGFGLDELWGHGGADRFVFIDERDRGDILKDFSNADGDILDLSLIDADTSDVAHDSFTWGGTMATAHGLWYAYDATAGVTRVYGDTDGNIAKAEFWFEIAGNVDLQAAYDAGRIDLVI